MGCCHRLAVAPGTERIDNGDSSPMVSVKMDLAFWIFVGFFILNVLLLIFNTWYFCVNRNCKVISCSKQHEKSNKPYSKADISDSSTEEDIEINV